MLLVLNKGMISKTLREQLDLPSNVWFGFVYKVLSDASNNCHALL